MCWASFSGMLCPGPSEGKCRCCGLECEQWAKRITSVASTKQLGVWGRCKPPRWGVGRQPQKILNILPYNNANWSNLRSLPRVWMHFKNFRKFTLSKYFEHVSPCITLTVIHYQWSIWSYREMKSEDPLWIRIIHRNSAKPICIEKKYTCLPRHTRCFL